MIGLGALITAAYVPGWTGATVLSGWVVLSVLLPFYLFKRIEMGAGHWIGLAFLAYASVSIIWAPIWQQAIWDLWLTWILAFCFCLGAQYYNPKIWVGMAIGLSVCDGFAIAQWFGFEPVYANNFHNTSGVYPGTYINPDMFGETACLISIALIISRIYWPLILTLPVTYLTGSRVVIVAYAAVIAAAIWSRWKWRSMIPILIVLLMAGWWVTSSHKYSTQERFALWEDTAGALTLTGYGAGSFFMLYPKFAKRTDTMSTRPEDPHNEFLNLAFEYGIGSLPVLALLALGFAASFTSKGIQGEGYILVAFLTIAVFSFPTRIPTEGFIGMVALGRLCSRRNLAWVEQLAGRSLNATRAILQSRANRAVEQVYSHKGRV